MKPSIENNIAIHPKSKKEHWYLTTSRATGMRQHNLAAFKATHPNVDCVLDQSNLEVINKYDLFIAPSPQMTKIGVPNALGLFTTKPITREDLQAVGGKILLGYYHGDVYLSPTKVVSKAAYATDAQAAGFRIELQEKEFHFGWLLNSYDCDSGNSYDLMCDGETTCNMLRYINHSYTNSVIAVREIIPGTESYRYAYYLVAPVGEFCELTVRYASRKLNTYKQSFALIPPSATCFLDLDYIKENKILYTCVAIQTQEQAALYGLSKPGNYWMTQGHYRVCINQACTAGNPLYWNLPIVDADICPNLDKVTVAANLGVTALMIAAQQGNLQGMRYLYEAGADLNLQDQRGRAAIYYALQNKQAEVVKFLFDHIPFSAVISQMLTENEIKEIEKQLEIINKPYKDAKKNEDINLQILYQLKEMRDRKRFELVHMHASVKFNISMSVEETWLSQELAKKISPDTVQVCTLKIPEPYERNYSSLLNKYNPHLKELLAMAQKQTVLWHFPVIDPSARVLEAMALLALLLPGYVAFDLEFSCIEATHVANKEEIQNFCLNMKNTNLLININGQSIYLLEEVKAKRSITTKRKPCASKDGVLERYVADLKNPLYVTEPFVNMVSYESEIHPAVFQAKTDNIPESTLHQLCVQKRKLNIERRISCALEKMSPVIKMSATAQMPVGQAPKHLSLPLQLEPTEYVGVLQERVEEETQKRGRAQQKEKSNAKRTCVAAEADEVNTQGTKAPSAKSVSVAFNFSQVQAAFFAAEQAFNKSPVGESTRMLRSFMRHRS